MIGGLEHVSVNVVVIHDYIYIVGSVLQVFTYAPKMHHFKYKISWCTKMSCFDKNFTVKQNLMAAFHMGKEIFF